MSHSSHDPGRKFFPFMRLPLELRCMIWELAIPLRLITPMVRGNVSKDSIGAWAKAFPNRDTITQLRQINVINFPVKSDSCTADWGWTSEDRRSLIGTDSVVLVDLRDEREVIRIRKILNRAMDPGRCGWTLMGAFDHFEEHPHSGPRPWGSSSGSCSWSTAKYNWYRNRGATGLPVPREISGDWDENYR
ncbi:hypothetical protein DL769_007785 [Monosporascus sp. CRB-8-3]|nr:hypothetical protein DL769_007785 [Monosporascus sp. CRB-8-3]